MKRSRASAPAKKQHPIGEHSCRASVDIATVVDLERIGRPVVHVDSDAGVGEPDAGE